ncbi:MAG: NADH-quinone oxidoreductase subunit D [Blastocatellia bacterium AA13]|nr:MAG: NADH-quinone oxidoreductase subunit D [Blastocatellia bacterium AA13]
MREQGVDITPGTLFDAEEMVINMGPQHPSTHGVLRVILKLDGETVKDLDCDIGYLHRGVEKIAEHDTYAMITPYWDRLDYVAAVSNDLCYVGGVEKLLGIEVPRRAEYLRVALTELQRIASHLLWLGTHAIDIGAVTVLLYAFREREEILKIFEDFIGARLTAHAFRIGGLWWDAYPEFEKRVRDFLKILPGRIDEYETLLNANRIWLSRTVGIGVLPADEAINLSLTGPVLRGSGVKYDLRRAQPYSVYPEFDFEIPIGENGDTYDRYLVRMAEIRQSIIIIEQALDGLPEGPVMAKVPKVIKPPVGEVYFGIEAPKGEIGVYLVSDGTTKPYRMRIRPPAFINLQSLRRLSIGHLVADVVALIGTIDIVLGEVDR